MARPRELTCREYSHLNAADTRRDRVLDGQRVLVTGATGKIAFPIARALAKRNEVWGAARFTKPGDRDKLGAAGVVPLQLDMSHGDLAAVPDDFTYVFHAAVDAGTSDWRPCVQTNADHSGKLLHHCRRAKGFVYCSTGSIYKYQGQRPLTEADGPGVPDRANYSFSKIAGEAVCTWGAGRSARADASREAGAAASRQAEQLQSDLRGRLRRPGNPSQDRKS